MVSGTTMFQSPSRDYAGLNSVDLPGADLAGAFQSPSRDYAGLNKATMTPTSILSRFNPPVGITPV